MIPAQWKWLDAVADQIPGFFRGIEAGRAKNSYVMGERVINVRTVRLSLVAQLVDPGPNPLRLHASVDYPSTGAIVRPDGMVEPQAKHRSAKRKTIKLGDV